jgi:5'-deoxy-5'-methylthioadenosine phosphorylase
MTLAIIGGTGLNTLNLIRESKREVVNTPYGEVSAPVIRGTLYGRDVLFLPRHGAGHKLAPHEVNYRANIWALRERGASEVLAVAAVGGITAAMQPAALALPDQIIDYTWGRHSTYFDSQAGEIRHVDFTKPYCETLRQRLLAAARAAGVAVVDGGTYGATQGPRLETTAEIARMERDGCDLVGMTGMPEAVLARELELCYACCAVVANWAAGKSEGEITMPEIERHLATGMATLAQLLARL